MGWESQCSRALSKIYHLEEQKQKVNIESDKERRKFFQGSLKPLSFQPIDLARSPRLPKRIIKDLSSHLSSGANPNALRGPHSCFNIDLTVSNQKRPPLESTRESCSASGGGRD